MVLSIFIIQILHFLINITGYIHICAVKRFTGQFHVKSPGQTSTLKKIDFYSLFHLYIIILAQKASF